MASSASATRPPGPLGGLVELIHKPAASGLALMVAAAFAFAWANSPWAASYVELFQTPFRVGLADATLEKPLLLWINDGLMALFFLLVGLEVKREIAQGELSTFRKAALPVAAAIGGMIVPALLYVALNAGGIGMEGWAIPMATDIAFALGVLALLGNRVPFCLKVFLAAFAVADDIGAVTVIALFYTADVNVAALAAAGGLTVLLVILNRLQVKNLGVYHFLGLILWFLVLKSGVHATIAGVVLALTIPLQGPLTPDPDDGDATDDDYSPLVQLEHTLHPWVAWLVLPIFAMANAGVNVVDADLDPFHPIAMGITLGLVVGKLIGIPLMSWIAVKLNLAELPEGANWGHVVGIGLLGGIGFTMSIFIAGLSFADPVLLDTAKMGIMSASLIAGTLGVIVLLLASRGQSGDAAADGTGGSAQAAK